MKLASKSAAPAKKFEFQPLTAEFMQSRKNRSLSGRDSFINPSAKLYRPGDGDNAVRFLPRIGEQGYGIEIWVHYGIGADNAGYLCLAKHKEEECPICVERQEANDTGDTDYAKSLKISPRTLCWVIDRAKEGEGPKLWAMPAGLERDMAAVGVVKKTNEVIQFLDVDEGFDFNFTLQNAGKQTAKYGGANFDRDPSALSQDDDTAMGWLQHAADNPLEEQLVFFESDHIAKQFSAAPDGETPKKGKPKLAGKLGLVSKSKKAEEAEKPTWDEVHAVTQEDVVDWATDHGITDLEAKGFGTMEEVHTYLCEQLEIEAPAKPKAPAKKGGLSLGKKKEAEKPTWEDIQAVTQEDVVDWCAENGLKGVDEQGFTEMEQVHKWIAEQLEVEVPEEPKKGGLSLTKKKSGPTKEEIEAIEDISELGEYLEKHGVDISDAPKFTTMEEAHTWACERAGISEAKPSGKGKLAGKLAGLKSKANKK